MRKRSLVLFILLLVFWLVISEKADSQHILAGVIVTLITVWFWQDLGPRLPGVPSAMELLGLGHCFILLVGYVFQANIAVAKTLLFSRPAANPIFVVLEPNLTSNWGRVLLATCITITPGTVTVDVDPETGRFIVHALTEETGLDLLYWRLIDKIRNLEIKIEGREKHVVVTGGANGLDSRGTAAGDYRPDNH
ncbi:MAG: Na+/H+ antiporter subunit E [Clostridiales bacterium]|nr:Na+/H+ antiporter subunit E [Clostridiales bacterium]